MSGLFVRSLLAPLVILTPLLLLVVAAPFVGVSCADDGAANNPRGAVQPQPQRSLSERVLQRAANLGISTEHISFHFAETTGLVDGAEAREAVTGYRESQLRAPASALKVLTACAAYDLLGADFRFETDLRLRGRVRGDLLDGDLIVVGRGDPGISGRYYDGDPMRAFDPWIAELKRRGVQRVSGALVADDRYLAGPQRLADWPRDQLHRWYCAPSGALNLNDNCIDVRIAPTAGGSKINVALTPATTLFRLDHKIEPVKSSKKHRYSVDRRPGEWAIKMRGGFLRTGSERVEFVTVPDPTMAFLGALAERLRREGIHIAGGIQRGDGKSSQRIAVIERPVHDVIEPLLKKSQNLFGDCLARVIDRVHGGSGDFAGAATRLRGYLESHAAGATDGATIRDGSGLSSKNQLSARSLTALLCYARTRVWYPRFRDALPLAGEDGTLSKRFRDHPLRGKLRAKTGHINGVSALTGITPLEDGREVVFALLYQGPASAVRKARRWQEAALEELARGTTVKSGGTQGSP